MNHPLLYRFDEVAAFAADTTSNLALVDRMEQLRAEACRAIGRRHPVCNSLSHLKSRARSARRNTSVLATLNVLRARAAQALACAPTDGAKT